MEEKEKTLYEELFGDTASDNNEIEVNDNKDIAVAIEEENSLDLDNIISFDKEEKKEKDVTLEDANLFKIIDDTLYDLKLNLEDNDVLNNLDNSDNEEVVEDNNTISEPILVKKDDVYVDKNIEEKQNNEVKENKYKDIANYNVDKKDNKKIGFLYYFGYVCIFIMVLATFSFSILFVAK